ncbi:AAA domain-containing protein [Nocardia sp. CA-136227]|uniref:DEAD/DEAH box helicase n=1 Tax=Nocardia sp. CA-136227 TaxID=3239979 RepID=UPI003D97E2A5
MGEADRQARILRYWRAVEYFSPPKVDATDWRRGIRNVDGARPLPWAGGAKPHESLRKKCRWQHTVYVGVFDLSKVREVLDATLRVADEEELDLDSRTGGQSALLSLTVNSDGLLIRDSVTLSSCAWAIGRTVNPGPASDSWLTGFDDAQKDILAMAFGIGDGRVPITEVASDAPSVLGRIAGTAARIALDTVTGGVSTALAGAISGAGPLITETLPDVVGAAADFAGDVWEVMTELSSQVDMSGSSEDTESDDGTAEAQEQAEAEDDAAEVPALGVKALDVKDLVALTRWVAEQLGVAEVLLPKIIRVKSYQVNERSADDAGSDEFLNSFYADDLERVAQAVESNAAGQALTDYLVDGARIDERQRVDVRGAPEQVLRSVAPSSMPAGRWPAKLAHTLTLSQQFAVNEIHRSLRDPRARGIFAVNGPPGTGKTTLLRDLIAAIVVDRAVVLARLESPGQAFGKQARKWRTGDSGSWENRLYPLIDELCGFEIVVASSNNGAVENITMEVPAADAVDTDEFPRAEYLSDQATLLMGKPAWGAVAARLGKRPYRSEFVERFWWGEGADLEEGEAGLKDLLTGFADYAAAGEQLDGIPTWEEAVAEFDEAMAEAARLAAERQHIADLLEREFDVDPELVRLRDAARDHDDYLDGLRSRRSIAAENVRHAEGARIAASTELAAARSRSSAADASVEDAAGAVRAAEVALREHDRQRPGFIKRVLSWGSKQEWEAEREPLMKGQDQADQSLAWAVGENDRVRAEVRIRQRAVDAATQTERSATGALRAVSRELDAAAADRIRTQDEIRRREEARRRDDQALAAAREWWPSTVPGSEWAASVDDRAAMEIREKSSPWMDEEFAAARTAVFTAALALHFAVLTSEPKRVRDNLASAMEIVRGRAPADLPPETVLDAWRLLFFVVPVISTTFASVSRMFATLGSEALGWLFIDEAGQATPQAAIGALWRSQRAVIVGDPRQLEPVNTLPWSGQRRLCTQFGVDAQWTPHGSSVQSIADRLNHFGTWLPDPDNRDELWVGSPLRVHRRCDRLMFEVSNSIAYDNLMVFGTAEPDEPDLLTRNTWLDVPAVPSGEKWNPVDGRYVVATLDLVRGRIRERMNAELIEFDGEPPGWAENEISMVAELNRRVAEAVFVVSPFVAVRDGLQKTVGDRLPREPKRLGTVHTTQGKESEIVILVLGTATDQRGSRVWASDTPNLLNVAITRAKRRLVIVGDYRNWSSHRNFRVLARYAGRGGDGLLTRVDAADWSTTARADWRRYEP